MSFAAPIWLVGLALAPVALGLYRAYGRRRQQYAVRFTNLDLLASVAPRTPGWRRHLPPLLYGLALLALVVALARPQITRAVPRERTTVMLVTDTSGSMQATDVEPTRLQAARSAASEFLDRVPDRVEVGLVAFSQVPATLVRPTTDRDAVREALGGLNASGGTATGDALDTALRAVVPQRTAPGTRGSRPPGAVVLLSDGKATVGRSPQGVARRARGLHVPVYTVALGTPDGVIDLVDPGGFSRQLPVPPDPQALREVARLSGGRYFAAPDADDLQAVYRDLGSRVGTVRERREITSAWAGGALALVLAGGVLSLLWFGRFP